MIEFGEVRREHQYSRVIIVGSGKSLEHFNFGRLSNQNCYIIAVNNAGNFVPFADAWFTLDPWGLYGPQLPNKHFKGRLFAAVPEDFATPNARVWSHRPQPTADITYLHRMENKIGLAEDPSCINTGNSGFGAMGMAYHLRPRKILLLGIDGGGGYFYTDNETHRNLGHLGSLFAGALPQLRREQIEVINGSPDSKVTCFVRHHIDYALELFFS